MNHRNAMIGSVQRTAAWWLRTAVRCSGLVWACFYAGSLSDAREPRFQPQTLDGNVQIGYGLAMGDVDGDQRADILLADKSDIVWYRNPGSRTADWQRHVMARQLTPRDNVCLAARDVDGDGMVEVAVGANWNPGETSDPAASGAVFYLSRPADPTAVWESIPLTPHDPTVHRMHWVRWGDDFRLLVLPLHGLGNRGGEGTPVRLMAYDIPPDRPHEATVRTVWQAMHMTHNFDCVVSEDQDRLWIAGREGLRELVQGREAHVIAAAAGGAGEVRSMRPLDGQERVVAIEPMHGTQVVVYQRDGDDWVRMVLDRSLQQGHALAAGDLLGRGDDQVVAGWRAPNADNRVGIRLYVPAASGGSWQMYTIDDNQMACEDLKLTDLDGDGRLDIVAAGRQSNNLMVYWNESP